MSRPLPAFNFQVEWGGTRMGFTEVSGLGVEVAVTEYREGNSKVRTPIKLPGTTRYGDVTLKRGVVLGDNEFFDWLRTSVSGEVERRDMIISLLDEEHQPVARWKLRAAFPTRYSVTPLDASANQVAIEELQVAHEGLEVENG